MTVNIPDNPQAMSLATFWRWAGAHYNCILRAGCDQCVIYDNPDLHWHLIEEEEELFVAQVIRGKDLITEMVIDARHVMYIEATPQDDNNVLFEFVGSIQGEPVALYHFLMAHGYEHEEERGRHRWTH